MFVSCLKVWYVEVFGVVYDFKYYVGVSNLLCRKIIFISKLNFFFVKINIEMIVINVGC